MYRFAYRCVGNHFLRRLPFPLADRLVRPLVVEWKITYRCNMKCSHCVYWQTPPGEELSLRDGLRMIRKLKDWAGTYYLSIYGGEPFLRPDLADIVNGAGALSIPVTITTNGTIPIDGWLRQIKDARGVSLNVSLDGATAETHQRYRGREVFEKTWKTLSCARTRLRTRIFTTIMKHNIGELRALAEISRKEDLPLSFQALFSPLGKDTSDEWYANDPLWPGNHERLSEVLDELMCLKKRGYPILNSRAHLRAMKEYFLSPRRYGAAALCKARFENLSILPDGQMKVCVYHDPIGNAFGDNLSQAWRSAAAVSIRRQMARCGKSCSILRCYFQDSLAHQLKNGLESRLHGIFHSGKQGAR